MKKSIKLCSVALMLAGCGVAGIFSASADTPAPKAGEAAVSAVGKALEKADFLTKDRPNPKAKYYLFLYSASWCGPCCREMPHVVRTYRKIRQTDDVELVLFSCDKTEEAAKAWAKEERMKFPIVKPKKGNGIPGYKPGGSIPRLGIVDGTGKIIITGHPATLLKDWRQVLQAGGRQKIGASFAFWRSLRRFRNTENRAASALLPVFPHRARLRNGSVKPVGKELEPRRIFRRDGCFKLHALSRARVVEAQPPRRGA